MDFIFRIREYHRPVADVNERGRGRGQDDSACSIQEVSARRSRTDVRAPANSTAARTTLSAGTMYIASCSPWARKASVVAGAGGGGGPRGQPIGKDPRSHRPERSTHQVHGAEIDRHRGAAPRRLHHVLDRRVHGRVVEVHEEEGGTHEGQGPSDVTARLDEEQHDQRRRERERHRGDEEAASLPCGRPRGRRSSLPT